MINMARFNNAFCCFSYGRKVRDWAVVTESPSLNSGETTDSLRMG